MNTPASPAKHLNALLHDLAIAGPRVANHVGLEKGWCLSAAGLAQRVLARAGYIGVHVLGVDFHGYNSTAWDLHQGRVPMAQWPDHAWSVGTRGTGRLSETTWDGHAVAYVPATTTGGHALLIDLSATQFSRPEYDLVIPPLVVPVSTTFLSGHPEGYELGSARILINRNPHLTAHVVSAVSGAHEFLDHLADLTEARMADHKTTQAGTPTSWKMSAA